jgi:hypothetical protein
LCGAEYTVVNEPVAATDARAASFTSKTGWRSRGGQRAKPPVLPVHVPEGHAAEISEGMAEETLNAVPEDNLVLEQEPDEGADVADLGVEGIDTKES